MPVKIYDRIIKTSLFDGHFDKNLIDIIKNLYYENVTYEEMLNQLKNATLYQKSLTNKVFSYFFEKLANDTTRFESFSLNQTLKNDTLIQIYINKIKKNPEFFGDIKEDTIVNQFKTAIRLGGSNLVYKTQNFPLKKANEIIMSNLNETQNKVYLDTSAGWGNRMLAAAANNMIYRAFDVNHELIEKLNELGNTINSFKKFDFEIYEQGSQFKKTDLIDQCDFLLTSPPYFTLERYPNQPDYMLYDSTEEDYSGWKEDYLEPTILNINNYLKKDASAFINFKSFMYAKTPISLVEDTCSFSKNIFSSVDVKPFNIKKRFDSSRKVDFGQESLIHLIK